MASYAKIFQTVGAINQYDLIANTNIPLIGTVISTPVDGVTLTSGMYIVLSAQTNPDDNGVYFVAVVGGNYTLALESPLNASMSYVNPLLFTIAQGTINAGSTFRFTRINTVTSFEKLVTSIDVQKQTFVFAIDTGTADNYIVSLNPPVTSLTNGLALEVKITHTNLTTNPVITVNANSAVPFKDAAGNNLAIGALVINGIYRITYSTTASAFIVLNPSIVQLSENLVAGTTVNAVNVNNTLYNNGLTNAITQSLLARLSETISVKEFGAVGDGVTDDTTAIQNAINSSALTIEFSSGLNYLISAPLTLKSNLTLFGNNSTIVAANQSMIAMFSGASTPSNIAFMKLNFDGQGIFSTVFSNSNNGIVLSGNPFNITVANCTFTGLHRSGLFQGGSVYNISTNYAYDNGESGFSFNQADKITTCNNTIDNIQGNSALPPQYGDGIYFDSCTNVIASNNIITRCIRDGIVVEGSTSQCKNLVFSGNAISELSGSINGQSNTGIYIDAAATDGSVTITGNVVSIGATWSGNQAGGIVCAGGGVITGNKLSCAADPFSNSSGIQISGGDTLISDNDVSGFEFGVANGSSETNGTYFYQIINNKIQENSVYGILFNSQSAAKIENNIIKDNGGGYTLAGNAYAGAGIRLTSSGLYSPTVFINNNVFISSANEGATTGQLYGIINSRTGGTQPTVAQFANNIFIMTGTFSTPYPNGTVLPACIGTDAGSGSITVVRDIIGDKFNNLCTKAPTGIGGFSNSPSGYQRYIGQASAAPSGSVAANVGDFYINTNVSANSNLMWVCTVAGTPGTWQESGFINSAPNIRGGTTNSLPYQSAANTTAMLSANATATTQFLSQVSSGTPTWSQPAMANISDYTTGTWTPADASGAGLTFSAVHGGYIQIGKICHAFALFSYPATADTSTAVIGGLPFTIINNTFIRSAGNIISSTTAAGKTILGIINTTTVQPTTTNSGSTTNANNTGTSVYLNLTYYTT